MFVEDEAIGENVLSSAARVDGVRVSTVSLKAEGHANTVFSPAG
jgi:hypothetical protein